MMSEPLCKRPDIREKVIDFLAGRFTEAPGRELLGTWVDHALTQAEGRHHEEMALDRLQEIHKAAGLLAEAVTTYVQIQTPEFGTSLPVEDQDRFLAELRTLVERSAPTDWDRKRAGKGRRRLPVHVIALHEQAVRLLSQGDLKPKFWQGDCALLGGMLCLVAGVVLPAGESTKAAKYVCDAGALEKYALLPYKPLPYVPFPD